MARIESNVRVSKTIGEVFAFLDNAQNHAKFIPNMAEFKQTSSSAFGQPGATAQGYLRYFGIMKIEVSYEIIEHEPDHKFAMKGKMGPVKFKDGYILTANENGTRINFWLELNPTGWTTVFRPFAGLIGRIHAWETLRNMKREIYK